MRRTLVAAALLAACGSVLAQAASAPSSPAKKELVQKLLTMQQPGIEGIARQLVEQPAAQLLQQAGVALQQRVPADKREAVAKDIQADAKKYVDEAFPPVRDAALKLAPSIIGAALEERFTEDELKQLIAWFESPVNKKYQQMGPEIQRSFNQRLIGDTQPAVEAKFRAFNESVARRLGMQPTQPASGASAPNGKTTAPAPKASAPKK
jgi:uncharacterized protein